MGKKRFVAGKRPLQGVTEGGTSRSGLSDKQGGEKKCLVRGVRRGCLRREVQKDGGDGVDKVGGLYSLNTKRGKKICIITRRLSTRP